MTTSFKTYAGNFDDSDTGYGLVSAYSYSALKDGYTSLWNGMVVTKPAAANAEAKAIVNAKERLRALEARTGVPWFVIGALLVREAGLVNGGLDFKACLHNGERIIGTSRKTKLVPKGKGPFATFEDAAVDALQGYKNTAWSPEFVAYTFEKFNGFGYRNKGIPSPYLWGGTNRQRAGKYVADGVYNASVMDPQIGGMAMLKALMAMDSSASFDRAAKNATDLAEQPLSTSSINQGAAGVGGLGGIGIVATVWDKLQYANDRIIDALTKAMSSPLFWVLVVMIALAAYIIWKRKVLRDDLRSGPPTEATFEIQGDENVEAVDVPAQPTDRRVRVARKSNGRRNAKVRSAVKRSGRRRRKAA